MPDVVIAGPGNVRQVGVTRDPGVRADPNDFGAQIGAALGELGQTVTRIGGQLHAQIQEPRDRLGLLRYTLDREEALINSFEEAKASTPAGAAGFADGLRGRWAAESAAVDWAPYGLSRKAQQQAQLVDLELQRKYAVSALTWERNEAVRQLGEDTKSIVGRIIETSKSHGDFGRAWGDITASLEAAGKTLSPEEETLLRSWASLQLFNADNAVDPEGARSRLGITDPGMVDAAAALRHFEGYREEAYWDVNAYRAGYGSDTTTLADGTVVPITKDTVVTREDSERDLARRTREFATRASQQVGSTAWSRIDGATRAALTSVAYNYGSLPESVVGAVRTGDRETIATAVESLSANPGRRSEEAAIIRGGSVGGGGVPDPRYADIPYEDRAKLYDESLRAQAAAEKAAYNDETERETEYREEITKTGYDMMLADELAGADAPRTLTQEWVEANRDILNVSDYKAFLKTLEPDETARRTPPKEYVRLLDLAESDPEEAIRQVRDLYVNDVIAKDVFSQIMSRAGENLQREGGRNFATELRSYVSTSLTPSPDAPDWQQARKLDALFQFDDFLEKNENADRETLRKQAQMIVDDYRKIRYGTGISSLPLPRFASLTAETMTEAELEKIKLKTVDEIRGGRMNEREAAEQAALLRRWLDVVRYRD